MNDTEDSDDEFMAATQVSYYGANGWTSQNQRASTSGMSNHGASTSQGSRNQATSSQRASTSQTQNRTASVSQRSQNNVASTNQSSQNQGASSQNPQNHGASSQVPQNQVPTNSNWQQQLQHLTQASKFLQDQITVLVQSGPGKNTKEDKKDKKMKPKEKHPCKLCPKVLANTTNLFRHYKAIHNEFNPERFGYTVNDSILNIDDSMTQEHCCGICGYANADKNALDVHTAVVHRNDVREHCKVCGYKASSKNDLDNHSRIHVNNDNNNNVVDAIKDKMHKCEECSCYFDDKSKFDEHMKTLHGFEVLCKICNKNFRFKDFENHVKDNHPDVFNDKDVNVNSNVIVENNVRTKKGRAIVFKCTKCTEKFGSKSEAWRHSKMHKKEVRRRDVGNSQAGNSSQNREDVNTNNEERIGDIIYICEVCNIATASYDVVVEHSQKHIRNPEIQFLTNDCSICCLKFEPICHDKHIDMHYANKRLNKESFKYLKYKYHLLLTADWLKFFNMADEVVNRIVSRSIYAYTRSIKMRVVSGRSNTITLYQCMQCDNFVEPSAVRTHAVNFDTCVEIRTSFICNVCERSFTTELAHDNHEVVHNDMNDNDSFRIVMFNDDGDREFNHILNNIVPIPDRQVAVTNNDENNAIEKVIYKCSGCSLCFILKESANIHIKSCPSHKQKKMCQICENWFNMHELVDHYYEHHFSEKIRLITNDIVPDIILVSDDESNNEDNKDALEVLSSDDEDENKSDKTKQRNSTDCIVVDDDKNEPQTSETENVTQANPSDQESNIQPNLLVPTESVRDDVPMDEDIKDEPNQTINDENSDCSDHSEFEVSHDDDSQGTIINGECYNIPNIGDVAKSNEIKCVETNLLINPFYVRNGSERIIDAYERNENLASEIENTRVKIALGELNVKEEIPWYVDEEDTIMNERHVKQIKVSNVTSTDTIIDLSSLLTDDEDEAIECTQVNERPDVHVNTNYYRNNSVLSSTHGACNLENITTENVAHDLRIVQNGIISNSNIASSLIEERTVNVSVNENSRNTPVLYERRTVVNTDNISNDKETKIKIKPARNEEIENEGVDSEIEEILRPDDSTVMPFRNRINDAAENRFVVNNLEIQLSGENVIMKPNCNIC